MPTIPVKDEPKGVALAEPELIEKDVDILMVGGGMGCCGAAYEVCRWADKIGGISVMLLDKAALERSGAVAQGLSAINTYIGENVPDDYVKMVRTDLMGLVREDLIFDVGRHVDDSVHLFEEWGLPCWTKDADGHNLDGAQSKAKGVSLRTGAKPVRSGRWQIMINGESYKCIVAEAAKNALGQDRYMERVFIVKLLLDAKQPNRIAGAVGFSTRENKVFVFKANAILVACGGAVNVYRPRSTGEGMGRAWYPVWNAGSTYTMCAQVGAEMTMMENRFVAARFKDGYGPVGAWFLLFKAKATNAKGEDYCATNKAMLKPYEDRGYAKGHIIPTCLRNHMMLREMREGRGKGADRRRPPGHLRQPERRAAEAPRERSLGRLPRHVRRPGQPLGLHGHRAREEGLRDHADRALSARLPLRLLRHLGLRPGRSLGAGRVQSQGRQRQGLQPHDHGQRSVHLR